MKEWQKKRDFTEERAEAAAAPIAAANGCEVYDVEYVKEGGSWYLRAFIDKAAVLISF